VLSACYLHLTSPQLARFDSIRRDATRLDSLQCKTSAPIRLTAHQAAKHDLLTSATYGYDHDCDHDWRYWRDRYRRAAYMAAARAADPDGPDAVLKRTCTWTLSAG
jgi:hypothetical protein